MTFHDCPPFLNALLKCEGIKPIQERFLELEALEIKRGWVINGFYSTLI
jgi:hypothetical protein